MRRLGLPPAMARARRKAARAHAVRNDAREEHARAARTSDAGACLSSGRGTGKQARNKSTESPPRHEGDRGARATWTRGVRDVRVYVCVSPPLREPSQTGGQCPPT